MLYRRASYRRVSYRRASYRRASYRRASHMRASHRRTSYSRASYRRASLTGMHLSQARISHITTRAPLWLSHCGVAVFEKGGPESACIWLSDFGANGQLGANGLSGPPHQASNFFQAAHRPMGVRRQSAMTQFPYQIKSSLLEKKLLQFFKYELHLTKRPDSLESEYGMSECQNLPQR